MSDSHPAWIDKVAQWSRYLGMNPTRVRWRLIRWHGRREGDRRRLEQKVDHIKYAHKTCDQCGAVQDHAARVCSSCGAKLATRTLQVLRRLGVMTPEALSCSTVLALVIMTAYARVWVAQGGGFHAPPGALLLDFGADWHVGFGGDYWRLLTAAFLHMGFWHIAFNLIALASVGPQVEQIWGRLAMLFVFVATAVLGFMLSDLLQPNVLTAGASGGVCGLIGAAAGYGQRLGTTRGRTIRNDMAKWFAYTIVFGFAMQANNWAHLGGAAAGAAFGYTMRPATWNRPALAGLRFAVKLAGVTATVAALAIILTRTPSPPSTGDPLIGRLDFTALVCRIQRVDPAAARALYVTTFASIGLVGWSADEVGETCMALVGLRDACRHGSVDAPCSAIERAAADL
ncbi:MAG: rhomboid family intramembrane serine protease [Kofleriaceae bacterium]